MTNISTSPSSSGLTGGSRQYQRQDNNNLDCPVIRTMTNIRTTDYPVTFTRLRRRRWRPGPDHDDFELFNCRVLSRLEVERGLRLDDADLVLAGFFGRVKGGISAFYQGVYIHVLGINSEARDPEAQRQLNRGLARHLYC